MNDKEYVKDKLDVLLTNILDYATSKTESTIYIEKDDALPEMIKLIPLILKCQFLLEYSPFSIKK